MHIALIHTQRSVNNNSILVYIHTTFAREVQKKCTHTPNGKRKNRRKQTMKEKRREN